MEVSLGMTLRYLAVAVVWDIRSNFGVSTSEFFRSVWRVIDALNEEFPLELDLTDTDGLRN